MPNGNKYYCRVSVTTFTCDLPARAMVMNMVQYNGFYGCSHCKQKGEMIHCGTSMYKYSKMHVGITSPTSKHGRVHSFPYEASNPTGPQRTSEDHWKEAIEAVEKGMTVIHIL